MKYMPSAGQKQQFVSTHTVYCIALYITMLAGFTLDFSHHVKGLFSHNVKRVLPWEPKGPLGPYI